MTLRRVLFALALVWSAWALAPTTVSASPLATAAALGRVADSNVEKAYHGYRRYYRPRRYFYRRYYRPRRYIYRSYYRPRRYFHRRYYRPRYYRPRYYYRRFY